MSFCICILLKCILIISILCTNKNKVYYFRIYNIINCGFILKKNLIKKILNLQSFFKNKKPLANPKNKFKKSYREIENRL